MMHKVNQNQGNTDNLISEYLFFAEGDRFLGSVEKYWGLKQKHKKQPFSDACASHLSLVVWRV
ncbi:MAG: hypothetical protein MSS42_00310 [Bacteroidales bacterium]|nr:hypothetical protein [Bacteroidales bacterium]